MPDKPEQNTSNEDILDKSEQIQRLLYRIIPFWPFIILATIMSIIGARIYLRYQVPVYLAKGRIIVNDATEQKSANLQEILTLDTRNLSSEAEREMQILQSRDLLTKLAIKLQLNINYFQRGRIRTAPYNVNELPFRLELENPDTVKRTLSGIAQLLGNNKIKFNEETFPVDSIMPSVFGNIRWKLNPDVRRNRNIKEVEVVISPIRDAVLTLKSSLGVFPISKQSSILDLTYSDQIPARAINILTELVNIYGISGVDYKGRIYENSQRFLDGRLKLVSEELSGVEKDLQNYKSKEGIIDLSEEGTLYLNRLKVSDAKISEIDIQLEVLNQINRYVVNRNKTNDSIPATLGFTDPVLNTLLGQLYQAEMDLQRVKEFSGSKNPQIEFYEDVISKLKPGILNSIGNLRANLIASKTSLKEENAQMSGLLTKIPGKERLLLDISRQQAVKNAIYTFLLQKKEESAIAAASVVPDYRLIEKPDRGGIVSPVPVRVYSFSFFIAMLLVIIYIYLKEFASKRILFRSQIEEYLPLPVISELIYHEHNLGNPVVVGEGKRTLIAEQFRELRTNINFITAGATDKCKTILMTSSIPKEGKSFVAINTAISLSLTGDKVVLLEFDLRKPKISKPLGIVSSPGISNFLVGNASVSEIVKSHASIKNLSVVPAGPIPPNPAELMSSAKLTELINKLKEEFDFIIIDSPPIAAVTDAKILSPFADAIIYIIRHNYTNNVFLNLLNDVNQKKGLKNINIVFNGIKHKKILGYGYSTYGYGYGYGYSYGYGYTVEDSNSKSFFRNLLSKLRFGLFGKKSNN